MEALTRQLQASTLGVNDSLPFDPGSSDQFQHVRLGSVPRYLFRLYTPYSDGDTDAIWVKSRDFLHNNREAYQDIFQTTNKQVTAGRIWGHLDWQHLPKDNLMSWTSSLLVAIRYIFYRRAVRRDQLEFRDIRICVVDTREFHHGAFVSDLDLLEAFKRYSPRLARFADLRATQFYFGEYLSQGALKIEGKCSIVSAQGLIDAGLLSLRDEFQASYDSPRLEWAKKVVELRRALDPALLEPSLGQQIRTAQEIGNLFDRKFRLPVAIQLTALCPGHLSADVIVASFAGGSYYSDERDACAAKDSRIVQHAHMEELTRARLISDIIYAERRLSAFEDAIGQAQSSLAQCEGHISALEGLFDEVQISRLKDTLRKVEQTELACTTLRCYIAAELEVNQVI